MVENDEGLRRLDGFWEVNVRDGRFLAFGREVGGG